MEETLNLTPEVTGAEEPEVAAPAVETGAEEPEVAEPVVRQKNDSDAAFAEMRRQLAAEKEARTQVERQNKEMSEALGLFFNGQTPDLLAAQAIAYHSNRPVAEIQAEQARKTEVETLRAENERLTQQVTESAAKMAMENDLREIQKIDPKIKSLDDLGQSFAEYIRAGLSGVDAYYAVKAREADNKITPPKPPGKINAEPQTKDYYTREEVMAMSPEERRKHWKEIRGSQGKW